MGRFAAVLAILGGGCGSPAGLVAPDGSDGGSRDIATASPRDLGQFADISEVPDLVSAEDLYSDLATPIGADLSGAPDMSTVLRDLSIIRDMTFIQIDFALYPGCGGPGLPTGESCSANNQCCHGLCDSANHMAPRTCCYAKGTNCQSNGQCCSGFCIGGSQCN